MVHVNIQIWEQRVKVPSAWPRLPYEGEKVLTRRPVFSSLMPSKMSRQEN